MSAIGVLFSYGAWRSIILHHLATKPSGSVNNGVTSRSRPKENGLAAIFLLVGSSSIYEKTSQCPQALGTRFSGHFALEYSHMYVT
jgi:hypothetical protein